MPAPPTTRSPCSFLTIPRELRDIVYAQVLTLPSPLYLYQEPHSPVALFAPDKPKNQFSLLFTNRQICRKAAKMLCSTNEFFLLGTAETQHDLLEHLLNGIGVTNASFISCLCISFLFVHIEEEGQMPRRTVKDDSMRTIQLIRENCTKLSVLEMDIDSKSSYLFKQSTTVVTEALSVINTPLKDIQSLIQIKARVVVREGGPTAETRRWMHEPGWEVTDD
ncbi:hypothetical protein BU23DRAFT_454530 [Bimuria novae-zelandiae CBS 107.79]|uniref:Uncharacterized protein n=1 Tax=Bimuria novae-zelandiae CBS 107.79 TaxID=1447943 RepID=A0A6A5VIL7_9PLEO|nr:hypothetical protein BU23DRAFT_454530 [Bimuria novae-zelandiae CBS 107.79]